MLKKITLILDATSVTKRVTYKETAQVGPIPGLEGEVEGDPEAEAVATKSGNKGSET